MHNFFFSIQKPENIKTSKTIVIFFVYKMQKYSLIALMNIGCL